MESSWLLADEIAIENERIKLSKSGMSWIEIKNDLNAKYRESSKKGLFRCMCCNATADMVLNEDKACYFKHRNGEECAGSRNYKRYNTGTSTFEKKKHKVGKAIIMDQLRSSLSRFGAAVIDGYLHNEDLKFVPDIIVKWPSGAIWTFDYVTGTRSDTYQNYLMNKQKTYHSKNFKGYFFFDHSQIAYKQEQHSLALSHGEKGSLPFVEEDELWNGLLEDLAEKFGDTSLVPDSRLELTNMKVQRLLYVTDDIDGVLYKITQLQRRPMVKWLPEIPDRWFMIVGAPNQISISDLFVYNHEAQVFEWEKIEVSSEELNEFVALVESRYQAMIETETELSKKEDQQKKIVNRRYKDEQQEQGNSKENSIAHQSDDLYTNMPVNESDLITRYSLVLDKIRSSTLMQTHPNFKERIKECEEDIRSYNETGELANRIHSLIRMMETALRNL